MRVLLFGVDGLTFRILDPLMERGLLPNFQRVREKGVQGILRSTIPPMTPPAWMSIATGLPPARHGVYDFWEYEQTENGPRARIVTHRKGGKALWNILSESGKRVVIANVPMTYPPEPVNGIMLSGYMAPDMQANVTSPASFKDELLRAVPDYCIDLIPAVSGGQIGDLLADTLKMTRERIAMFSLLLSKPWDFCFIVFVGADRIQHLRWDEIMAFHPQAVEYYQMVDEALGMALDALKADDLLMVVSDHGFQGARRKFYMQEYLLRQGLLRMSNPRTRHRARLWHLARDVVHAGRLQKFTRRLSAQLRRSGAIAIVQEHHPIRLPDLDWANTSAWIPSSSGTIAGYADLFLHAMLSETDIDEVMTLLREIRDPQTGYPLALDIHREDVFGTGPFMPPERHLVLLSGENITPATGLGRRNLWETSDVTTGIHHPDGVLYLYGTRVKSGTTIAPTYVYDVVPTILTYMGIPPSQEMSGRMLAEAFEHLLPVPGSSGGESAVRQKLKKLAAQQHD